MRRRAYKTMQSILLTNRLSALVFQSKEMSKVNKSTFVSVVYLITLAVQATTQKWII